MEKMHYNISVRLFTAGKCFGPGMAALLSLVRERHSLRAAAAEMGMAYSKAWRILRDCEGALGFPLLDSTTGGECKSWEYWKHVIWTSGISLYCLSTKDNFQNPEEIPLLFPIISGKHLA